MRDIWALLIQTLTVSGAAAVVLLVKEILRDKLSPRWQFCAWGVVGLMLLLPAGYGGRYVLIDWPLLVESVKSLLTGSYTLTKITAPIPLLPRSAPQSIWDWLFVGYLAGVVFCLARYLVSYVKLRAALRHGVPLDAETERKIQQVEKQYQLHCCRAVMVPSLQSAFVCGVFHPILVLPAEQETNEKVLLHEMLHLKYKDVVWGMVICWFRCIHWCNPFLWYCANRAQNDIESLCDQRVLERLEGEDRREYGRILLSMTNEKYARAPGTSSAANGGKNIHRRIESIARFKRYPAGMALVSVCILIVLVASMIQGSAMRAIQLQQPLAVTLARARLTQCTTPAGALDTYAKAMLAGQGAYRIMCAPETQREEISLQMVKNQNDQTEPLWQDAMRSEIDTDMGYYVYDLRKIDKNTYHMLLLMKTAQQPETEVGMCIAVQNVKISREGQHWVAEPLDDFQVRESRSAMLPWGCEELPAATYVAETEDFRVEISCQNTYSVKNEKPIGQESVFFGELRQFDDIPKPNAAFDRMTETQWSTLTYLGTEQEQEKIHQIAISYAPWESGKPRPHLIQADGADMAGSNTDGAVWESKTNPDWQDGVRLFIGGAGQDFNGDETFIPDQYAADLYINGEKVEELTLYPQEVVEQ